MRHKRIAVAAIAILATTAVVGVSTTARASETPPNWTPICIDNNGGDVCAFADGSAQPVLMEVVRGGPPPASLTNWLTPDAGQIGGIEQANTSLCMQVNASKGYVDEATCDGSISQQWSVKTYSDGNFNYESRWNTNDCLTYNQSAGDLDVHGCSDVWYEDIVLLSGRPLSLLPR
jgi:hypothetical protein